MKDRIKIILPIAIVSLCIVFCLFLMSIEYTGIYSNLFSSIWIYLTNTGGVISSGILTLIACVVIAISYKATKLKLAGFGIILIVFSIIFVGVAQLNEHLIKEKIMQPRPNITLLSLENNFDAKDLYAFETKKERRAYLQSNVIETKHGEIMLGDKIVKPIVWKHWIKEVGYSFPSGHSVNAFLMAFLLSYCFLLRYKGFGKYGVMLIYVWAVLIAYSRVIVGVHSNVDVSLGALWGTVIGIGIVSTGLFDYIDRKILKNS